MQIQNALAEAGFTDPTLPQIKAIPLILMEKNVLLISPTGTGKTEAVLLPIFSKMLERKNENQGIRAIYITPLRALNRDLIKRLTFWSKRLNISVEVRHGDTEMKIRRKQARQPPQMLVTTPETLQAILPGTVMRKHLSNVEFVVVDEAHNLVENKRGVQLTIALERLQETAMHEFQRIGLSATIGNPKEVAKFISGTKRSMKIIQALLSKDYNYQVEYPTPTEKDYETAAKIETSPEAAARIRRITELIDSHKSTLIFVNSRTTAEMLGHRFSQLNRYDIAVHHGSLSKEERVNIEDSFKSGKLKAIICTSTLELGIDIGNVDLTIQYMSPRQVGSLIQRVGRSGHSLERTSKGVIITVYSDDTLESTAAVINAMANKIEPVRIHENALDVLAHQTAGILMDKENLTVDRLVTIIRRAYPFRNLTKRKFLDVLYFLNSLNKIRLNEEGKVLKKTGKTREYYYGNLSMIPDERRYPVINVLTDRKVGTLGDEFMALDARIGLNFIMRGKVWRIVQIEGENGWVHVIPAQDPFAAIPGWDGEIIPVSFDLAQQTGFAREKIGALLKNGKTVEAVAKELSIELKTDKKTLLEAINEIEEHLKEGAPLPTPNHIVIEAFDKYLIIHTCFGEVVNHTLAGVFDALLSEKEVITGWWANGYRILIETPRTLKRAEIESIPMTLFHLTDENVEKAFRKYINAKFPYAYKMKFVAERFGALPRGKTMSYERQGKLRTTFENTPIYDETLREALLEKADLKKTKEIMHQVSTGEISVSTIIRSEKPTPLAYHILAQYADISELMAPERVVLSNIDKMKKALNARTVTLLCMKCGIWTTQTRIKDLPSEPHCKNCNSRLLTVTYLNQDVEQLKKDLQERLQGKELNPEEIKELTQSRRKADLILSYGKQAILALQVKGVGPETASRILGKMNPDENDFYLDLLKAKIQYLRTREFWDDKGRQ
jgi:ATP-dependent Lhr-like helicase